MKIKDRLIENIPFYMVEDTTKCEYEIVLSDEFMKVATDISKDNTYEFNRLEEISNLNDVIVSFRAEDIEEVAGVFNLAEYVTEEQFDLDQLKTDLDLVIRELDKQANEDNGRSLNIGFIGLYDVFRKLNIDINGEDAKNFTSYVFTTISNISLKTSSELAKEFGAYEGYSHEEKRKSVTVNTTHNVHESVRANGLRNKSIINMNLKDPSVSGVNPITQILIAGTIQEVIDEPMYLDLDINENIVVEGSIRRYITLAWLESIGKIHFKRGVK